MHFSVGTQLVLRFPFNQSPLYLWCLYLLRSNNSHEKVVDRPLKISQLSDTAICLWSFSDIYSTGCGFWCFPLWLICHLPFILFSIWSSKPMGPSYFHPFLLSWVKPEVLSYLLFQPFDFCIPPFPSLIFHLLPSSLLALAYPTGTFYTIPYVSFHFHLFLHHPSLSTSHWADFLLCPAWSSRQSINAEGSDNVTLS